VNSKSKHEPTLLREQNDKTNLTITSGTQGAKTRPKQRLAHTALSGTSKIGAEKNHEALVARLPHRPNKKNEQRSETFSDLTQARIGKQTT
jgi:hypothetical protein